MLLALFAAHAQIDIKGGVPPQLSKDDSVIKTVTRVGQWIVDILGVLSIASLIYAGFRYILAAGNEKEVEKAKELIKYTIIGLVVVILAFTIISTINNLF